MLETLPLKAVQWDLDGVIADSFEGHFHAWRQRFDGMGLKQAVASSVPQENIDAMLAELRVGQWFSALVAGASLPGRPDPGVFLRAAELLGARPIDIVLCVIASLLGRRFLLIYRKNGFLS